MSEWIGDAASNLGTDSTAARQFVLDWWRPIKTAVCSPAAGGGIKFGEWPLNLFMLACIALLECWIFYGAISLYEISMPFSDAVGASNIQQAFVSGPRNYFYCYSNKLRWRYVY
jgi:hypothetical protein